MPATPIKKLLSCEDKNLHKSAKKTKRLLRDPFIMSIFVNKVVTVGWVQGKSPQPPEVNEGF